MKTCEDRSVFKTVNFWTSVIAVKSVILNYHLIGPDKVTSKL